MLATMFHALAAAEEMPTAANVAKVIWPVLLLLEAIHDLHASGPRPFNDRYYGDYALAALARNATYESNYLYREVKPRRSKRWLKVAAGNPVCVDSLIWLVHKLPADQRASTGLRWVTALAVGHVQHVASRSFALQSWLIETRPTAEQAGTLSDWQELVNALVVDGAG